MGYYRACPRAEPFRRIRFFLGLNCAWELSRLRRALEAALAVAQIGRVVRFGIPGRAPAVLFYQIAHGAVTLDGWAHPSACRTSPL